MNRQTCRIVLWSFLLIGMVAGCGDDSGKPAESLPSPNTSTPVPPAAPDRPTLNIQFNGAADLSDESKSSLADLIESIQAGVVQITTGSGSASGFIITDDGMVVTNEHVVSGENRVGVWLTNGRRYDAEVLDRDATSDLALLQIDGAGSLDPIAVGDPNTVRIGDEVLALGFPLADTIGTNLTVTRGIISSTRLVDGVQLLQTDASLNPGNSGGPLVNIDGEVVGVNASRIEETDTGRPVSNIGFAVSVSELERRLPTLGGRQLASPGSPTATPTPMPTSDPTWTPAPTLTPEPTWTPAPTFTPEPTSTPTLTPTPTITPTPTVTPTPTATFTPTPSPTFTPTPTPIPLFIAVSVGDGFTCGLRADDAVVCRGFNDRGRSLPPKDERFTSISSGSGHTCGLRWDGLAVCWGSNDHGQSSPPEDERFISISSGGGDASSNLVLSYGHNCALRADGVAVCWGADFDGQSSPPDHERFISVSSGESHTCGLRDDGFIVCWGANDYGQSSPPRHGSFTSVSSGGWHTCALKEDGLAVCWGADWGDSPPEGERFTSISSGRRHTCGLRKRGLAVCWGDDSEGQDSAPSDQRFTSISSGNTHTCGLRDDGVIVCWGDNYYGQSSPPLR